MQQDASQSVEHEAAYRRGWQQGLTEASLILLQLVELERRSRKCAVVRLMSQSRERDTTGTNVVKAQPHLNPKGLGGQQQG